jgi:hypothetical protein
LAVDLYHPAAVENDFENLIGQVPVSCKIVENQFEQLALDSQAQSTRRRNTDKPSMKADVRLFAGRPRFVGRTAEIDAVVCDEDPVILKDPRFQLPVLLAGQSEMIHMRALKAALMGDQFE